MIDCRQYLVVGLTGGIASGKSTVSSLLAERYDIPVIDADKIAREVVEPGTNGFKEVVKHFSEPIDTHKDSQVSANGSADETSGDGDRRSVAGESSTDDERTLMNEPRKKDKSHGNLDVGGKDNASQYRNAETSATASSPSLSGSEYVQGSQLVHPSTGALDRAYLAKQIFSDPTKRSLLNRIIHPRVRRTMLWRVIKSWITGEQVVVLDVPLLIETGLDRWCGACVVVYVNEQTQLSRLCSRPSPNPGEPRLTSSQAHSRIRAQMPIADKIPHADVVLDNSGSKKDLEDQVDALVNRWRRKYGGIRWLVSWLLPPLGLLSAVGTLFWREVRRRRRGIGRSSPSTSSSSTNSTNPASANQ